MTQVSLTQQIDRTYIPADKAEERYLQLTLQMPDKVQQTDRLPLNLGLIIDRSGSMSGQKLEYVKEAAIHTVRLLTDQDRLSVIVYDDEVKVVAPSQAMTASARTDLIKRIREIKTGGMTNLSGGWFTGCDQIADFMSSDYLNRALLLTDGLANKGIVDQEKLVYEGKQLRKRGITTTTFGVGDDFNQFLLQGIADGSGGHFYFIESPQQIPNYFKGELGEMLDTVAREITLDLDLPVGVTGTVMNDIPYEQTDQRLRLMLGDAYANETRTLMIKLSLPAETLGQTFTFESRLQYEDAHNRKAVSLTPQQTTFTVADSVTCDSQSVNETVIQEAAQLEAEQAKMAALAQEYQGDKVGAQNTLRQARLNMAGSALGAFAAPSMASLDSMEESLEEGLTAKARKSLHYNSYRKQRSRKDYKDNTLGVTKKTGK